MVIRTCWAGLALAITVSAIHAQPSDWRSLSDANRLGSWRETAFRGAGKVTIADGVVTLGAGGPLTGVTWSGDFPRTDYEIRLEARRTQGGDFFASLTFPVEKSFCTWVTGGWGGDIVGLSSIDGWDASDNETRTYFTFENGRWYRLMLRVTEARISAWIDDKPIINVEIRGRGIGLRPGDIKLNTPLGFASYNSTGELRKIEYRTIRK